MTRISTRNRNGGGSSDKVSDEHLVIDMVEKLKSQGMFDRIRKQCLEEATRIPQYKELLIKVDTLAKNFLDSCNWSENLAKIELREELRRNISADDTLSHGITEIVEKLVKARMPKEFDSLAQKVVYEGLGGNYESWRARRAQRDRDRSRTTSRGQLQSQSSAKSPITPKGLTEPLVNNFLFPPPRLFLPTSSSAPLQTSLPNTLSSTQTFLPAHLPNFPLPPMSMVYPSVPLASNVINTQSAADEDVSRSKPQASAQASSGDVEITVEETTQCDDEMEIGCYVYLSRALLNYL
ncbi:unnamed protein product [Protopolystoma xenopodis]|uniref:BOD1/SHG1 domain-containing protein n=1 Tax=Protopolystoma xenopodis TaxID=117903 RepID=A0A3S5AMS3_9PLAT|nr:unnamed protein product [Protopolystoma xenopodis]